MTETSHSSIMDQARDLHRTLRELQQRVFLRPSAPSTRANTKFSIAQLTTMTAIRDRGELSLKELAERTNVSPPSASAMVDKLVDLGLAERRPNATDRREIRISLTPAGHIAASAYEGESLRTLVDLLDRIGPETAQKWREVYARIQDCFDREKPSELVAK